MFHNTGANAFAKNQMRLAYEDKRDLYCKCEQPTPAEDFLFRDILCAPAMGAKRNLTEISGNRDRTGVPRWRLAREGPFTNERSHASLRVLGKGCAFRHTTYSVEDHAPPEGGRAGCPAKSSPLPGVD